MNPPGNCWRRCWIRALLEKRQPFRGNGGNWGEMERGESCKPTFRHEPANETERETKVKKLSFCNLSALCLPASLCSECAARAAVQPVETRSEQEERRRRAFLGWIARFSLTETVRLWRLWRLWRVSGRYRTAPFFALIRSWFSSHTEAARNQIKLQLLTANFNALWLPKSLTQMFPSKILKGNPLTEKPFDSKLKLSKF